jgi:hypothetical protein
MKKILLQLRMFSMISAIFGAAQMADAQSVWNAVVGTSADTNWSTAVNWTPNGVPDSTADVVFDGTTAVADTTINNVVDSGFGGTIASLSYTNVNDGTFQNTLIANGVTLNVTGTGGLTVGSATTLSSDTAVVNTISGAGGALVVSNASANVLILLGLTSSGGATTATLNMTNLDTFSFTGAQLLLGYGEIHAAPAHCSGSLFLAKTNTISLSGTSPQMDIGDNGSSAGIPSILYLGQTNVINADSIAVGRAKQNGAYIQFNSSFTHNNPVAYFRGADGISPVATWAIGDGNVSAGTDPKPSGTCDFSGGTVDIVATSMWLGRGSSGAWGGTTPSASGTLTFTAGNISVNNLTNALLAHSYSDQTATGTINVNGTGTLSVGNFSLANTNGFTGTANGTLNINNGTVAIGTLTAGGGTSTINLSGGTLIVTNTVGSMASPLSALNLTGGSLHFNVDGTANVTNIVATTVTTSGTTTIAIDSIVNVSGTVQIPLISYTGTDPFTALSLGTVPSGYNATLVDNTGNSSVDLNITSLVKPTPRITGISVSGTTLNISATNGSSSGQCVLLDSTNVALPLSQWTPILTNNFDGSGNLNLSTNIINPTVPQEFYLLSQ